MLDDDDWDDEITLVGQMSDEIKALRQGYRQRSLFDEPTAPVDDNAENDRDNNNGNDHNHSHLQPFNYHSLPQSIQIILV